MIDGKSGLKKCLVKRSLKRKLMTETSGYFHQYQIFSWFFFSLFDLPESNEVLFVLQICSYVYGSYNTVTVGG